jgi:phage/plasmid-associated DNA primase
VPIARQDTDIANKLIAEMPGIFNRALAGLYRLTQKNGFTMPKVTQEATTTYQAESNPARRFLMTQTFHVPESSVPTAEVYATYRGWCQEEGVTSGHILSRQSFTKEVARFWKGKVEHTKIYIDETTPYRWWFKGLKVGA